MSELSSAGFYRRPLPWLVLCYVAGTWLGLNHAPLLLLLTPTVGIFYGIAIVLALFRRTSGQGFVLAICFATAMLAWGLTSLHPIHGNAPADILAEVPAAAELDVQGVVSGDPDFRALYDNERRVWSFCVDLLAVRSLDDTYGEAQGRIKVDWFGWQDARVPRYGEVWVLRGKVRENGGFARVKKLSVDQAGSELIRTGEGSWFRGLCYDIRRKAATRLVIGFEDNPDSMALPLALLLGYREQLTWGSRSLFAETGTLHIFAISGLHVGIFGGIIIFVLKLCRIPRGSWIFFLGPCLVMYAVATGARASAVRACIMAIIYFLAPALGRKADVPSGLSLAALLILIWDPAQLFNTGFIFSFTVVIGLLLFYPSFMQLLEWVWAKDPFLAGPGTPFQRQVRMVLRGLTSLAALSVAAWLSSAPLTAYFFGRFTPIALLGNIVVIPLAFLSVLCGCLSLVLGSCVDFLAEVFNHANHALTGGLVLVMRGLAVVPLASLRVGKPPLYTIYLCYALLIGLGAWLRHVVRKGAHQQSDEAPCP